MLGKRSILFFLLIANIYGATSLRSELDMLKSSATSIDIYAWDKKQLAPSQSGMIEEDSIALSSSALKRPNQVKDTEILEEIDENEFKVKQTRKRSR